MMTNSIATEHPDVVTAPVDRGTLPARDQAAQVAIRQRLAKAVHTCSEKLTLLREMAAGVHAVLQCHSIILLEAAGPGGTPRACRVLAGGQEGFPAPLQQALGRFNPAAVVGKAVAVQAVQADPGWQLVAVPLSGQPNTEILIAVVEHPLTAGRVTPLLELMATHVALWQMRFDLARREAEAQTAATLAELLGRLASSGELTSASYTLVNELQRALGCRQVVLGLSRNGATCRVAAISGMAQIDRRSERVQALEAVLDESVVRGNLTVWPPQDEAERHSMLAHKQLAASVSAGSVVSTPLRDEQGEVQGAWIFLGESARPAGPASLRLIEVAAPLVGCCLTLLRRAEPNAIQSWLQWARRALRGRWSVGVLAGLVLLIAAMCCPWPYRVKCDCELQPVVRRYVAAPFDATLERSYVEPGDLVSRAQLLARIDGREIRWELAGVAAEQTKASKQRDGHRAAHEFGSAEVARYEMERLALKTELLAYRGDNLDIRSPIDGIVITGDLKKAEGVPLSVGQTLFEIAPLDRMIVEIAVPEEEIRHVRTGQAVEIVLEAFPRERLQGTLARIHPRSELKETEHVFVAEFDLSNSDARLRPGMHGKARISTPSHPLAWNLFHKPWEKMLYWMGW